MAAGALAMRGRERERLVVIAQVCGKVLGQGAAAERLGRSGLGFAFGRSSGLFGPIAPRATQGLCRASAGGPRTVGSRRALANGRANCSAASIVILVRRWPAR